MLVPFTKMQALGNDFVVIDNRNRQFDLNQQQRVLLADRHFGVGCDQILLVESAPDKDTDFFFRIYNADGGEVGQCSR